MPLNVCRRIIRCSVLIIFITVCPAGLCSVKSEQLIVFVQTTDTTIENYFQKKQLPEIKKTAEELGVSLSVYDGNRGFPAEVTITPLIVYQNHLGRSIYQGRTTSTKRIKNFIRTSRRFPQGKKQLVWNDIPVQVIGKNKIWSPVKISPLSGTPPEEYNETNFLSSAREAVNRGFNKYHVEKEGRFGRCDRGFYMDFYPWCSGDGTLYLSLALFSQFHCKEPVFRLSGDKLTGSWEHRAKLFQRAAVIMEEAVSRAMTDPLVGDGFVSIDDSFLVTGWKQLGFDLPDQNKREDIVILNPPSIPTHWQIPSKHPEGSAAVQFRFPAPLDSYLGEAQKLSGSVAFPDSKKISGMTGEIFVDTFSIIMGEADLDETIKSSLFLDSVTYPNASFKIKTAEGNGSLEFGQLIIVNIQGDFQLKGKVVPLSLPLTCEVVIDERGEPALIITGSFSIDLRDFDIEGATGPEPEKYTLLFDLNLFLSPK